MRATSLCLGLFLSLLLLLAAVLPDRFAWRLVQVWGLSVSRLGIHRYHLIPGHPCF